MTNRFVLDDSGKQVIDTLSAWPVSLPPRFSDRANVAMDVLNFIVSSPDDDVDKVLVDPVSELKRVWLIDPCWEIEDTPGFAEFREELRAIRMEHEAGLAGVKNAKDAGRAAELGVTVPLAKRIDGLREEAKRHKGDAKHLLVHYLTQAGVIRDADNVSEVESIIDLIVDASAAEATAEFLLQEGRTAMIFQSGNKPDTKTNE